MNLVAASAVGLVTQGFTEPQLRALRYAWHDGNECVCAGYNVTRRGGRYTISASTLRALERQGFCQTFIHVDGGMAARLTERGRAVARVLERL